MKLRKCFSLLVIFALCIVLAACSKENDQTGNADNSNINTVTEGTEEEKNTVTETVTPEPENTTAVTDIVTPGPESTLTGVYKIFVTDTTGAPVEGATIQFCSDTECRTGKTDSTGKAEFDAEAGKYEVHVLKAPEGYVKDTVIYVADDSFSDITIVLEKEQNENV